jgi:mannose-6-phosphate isomerase-like protein (cupin superfamily)
MVEAVNLAEKFSRFQDYWQPKIVGEVDDYHVKLVKVKGEFVWHRHDAEDEMFLVVQGRLQIRLRDGEINLNAGEMTIIPHGVEHMPVAAEETHVLLLEREATLNTGNVQNERSVTAEEWI